MAHFKCQVTGIDAFPTSDLREREHFCLILFKKCGERGYFIHGEVQDEVVNELFASNFRRRPSNTSAGSGHRGQRTNISHSETVGREGGTRFLEPNLAFAYFDIISSF